jgi:hypothetical protein
MLLAQVKTTASAGMTENGYQSSFAKVFNYDI